MGEGIARVRLDDGTVVYARISGAPERPAGGGPREPGGYQDSGAHPGQGTYQDSGLGERVTELASGLADTVRGVAQSVRLGLAGVAPDEVTVEFGLELAAQEGRLVSLLAQMEGTASVRVALTWRGEHEPSAGSPGEPPASDR